MPALAVLRISSSYLQALLLRPSNDHSSLTCCTVSWLLRSNKRSAFPTHPPAAAANGLLLIRAKTSVAQHQGNKATTGWDEAADLYFSPKGSKPTKHNSSSQDLQPDGGYSMEGRAEKQQSYGKAENAAEVINHGRARVAGSSVSVREAKSLEDFGRGQDRVGKREYTSRDWRGLRSTNRQGSERGTRYNTFTARPSQKENLQRKSSRGSREEPTDWSSSYRNGVALPRKIVPNNLDDDEDEDEDDDESDNGRYRSSRRDWDRWDRREPRREPSEVPILEGEAIYGVGPIRAAMHACRRELHTLYIQENMDLNTANKRKAKDDLNWISEKAKSINLSIVTTSKHVLNMLVDNRPHQGLVLDASPLELVRTEKLDFPLAGEKTPVWIALDEVKDPQNFGAILRSAYFFGARGVVVCAKNSAPLSGVVSKASAGALEVMDLHFCRNMVKFLQNSIDNGWRAVGSSAEPGSMPLHELPQGMPTILVLGNEGVGLRTNVHRTCTDIIHIPGMFPSKSSGSKRYIPPSDDGSVAKSGSKEESGGAEVNCLLGPPVVESLNVSVAAGILLHQLLVSDS
ncbi:hypothetical protein O6H91_21G019100 [Diphasiastrum complanatum]|uniref:Uncharacterized protein n=1 Tax=Diphasiastrum complanatum TaxID=34168 RepID=A0ACC2AK81_DIPCM|nr:hypothetical protein O6H91_21G019100 [Diphasiastrum complanatum]